MNIYVGNLPYKTTEDELKQAFEAFGKVDRVNLPTDRETGRLRGFGFVEMPNAEEGQKAIDGMNGNNWGGRNITVNEARPREDRPRGGPGGGPRGPGGGGRGRM